MAWTRSSVIRFSLSSFRRSVLNYLLFLMLVESAKGFNVDLDTKVVHKMGDGDWFGFSVSLHKDGGRGWLLVGSPKAQTSQPGVRKGGAVYRCNPARRNDCQQIKFDSTGHNSVRLEESSKISDNKSEQWFGATVQSAGPDGPIVACAPRYIYFSVNLRRREPVGTCFVAQSSMSGFREYAPCRTRAWGRHQQGWCQAGMSAAITKDGKRLYTGAPGGWQWQGQVFSQSLTKDDGPLSTPQGSSKLDVTYLGYSTAVGEFSGDKDQDVAVGRPRGGANISGEILLFNSNLEKLGNISGDQIGSYFGYSITVVDVNNDKLDDIVVGAPLYNDYTAKDRSYETGRVYVLYQNIQHKFDMDHVDGRTSKGRFGLAVASLGDINSDDYGDVGIGAPYDGENGNGVVYIYHGSANGIMKKPSQIIFAEDVDIELSTFGFSLSGGLDIDSNNYPDLLVGAYNSDRAVFFRTRPVLTLVSDITVSPENILLENRNCELDDGTKVSCLNITVCFNYKGSGVPRDLHIDYELVLDADKPDNPRMFLVDQRLQNTFSSNKYLQKGMLSCISEMAYVISAISDKLTPITVTVTPALPDRPRGKRQAFQTLTPTLDRNVNITVVKKINIQKNCGTDQVCIPDLSVNITPNVNEYIIGMNKMLNLTVEVSNLGANPEAAYQAYFYMNLSDHVHYSSISPNIINSCDLPGFGSKLLKCSLGNPMPAGEIIKFIVSTNPKKFSEGADDFHFTAEVNSTNAERNSTTADNQFQLTIPVKVDATLKVDGVSLPETLVFNSSLYKVDNIDSEEDVGPEIKHEYKIIKSGESTILKTDVKIVWPSETLSEKPLLKLKHISFASKNVNCEDTDNNNLGLEAIAARNRDSITESGRASEEDAGENVRRRRSFNAEDYQNEMSCGSSICTIISCTITNLETTAEIHVTGRLRPSTVRELRVPTMKIDSKIITRPTKLPHGVDTDYLGYQVKVVQTVVDVVEEPTVRREVPWWILIVACCVGLLLLIIIMVILWKLGFFERKLPVEERPLRGDNNGYRSPKGDDAYL